MHDYLTPNLWDDKASSNSYHLFDDLPKCDFPIYLLEA